MYACLYVYIKRVLGAGRYKVLKLSQHTIDADIKCKLQLDISICYTNNTTIKTYIHACEYKFQVHKYIHTYNILGWIKNFFNSLSQIS